MRFQTTISSLLITSILLLQGCGDDDAPPAPFQPGPARDASVTDGSVNVPDAGFSERSCVVGDPFLVGEPETTAASPDRVQIIARPQRADEFLLLTAQQHCPQSVEEGACDGTTPGLRGDTLRRALLYSVPEDLDAPIGAPSMVNLGVAFGMVSYTHTQSPQMVALSNRLVVAWLDRPSLDAMNVWAQSVDYADLTPYGTQNQISQIAQDPQNPAEASAARRLVLTGDGDKATAFYEEYKQGRPPRLHVAEISSDGTALSNRFVKEIEASADSHAGLALSGGQLVFGRTAPTGDTGACDYWLGPVDEAGEKVQQDPSTRPCGEIAITEGGTVFVANSGSGVFFRPLSSAGEPMGDEKRLVQAGPGAVFDRPAIAPMAGGFFVAFVEYKADGNRLRGALIERDGEVKEIFDIATDMPDAVAWPSVAVANDGASVAVAWKHRALIEVDGGDGIGMTHAPTQLTNVVRLRCE